MATELVYFFSIFILKFFVGFIRFKMMVAYDVVSVCFLVFFGSIEFVVFFSCLSSTDSTHLKTSEGKTTETEREFCGIGYHKTD